MMAPFYKFGLFGSEVSLIVAFIIGIGFGFFLERAGFGSARKLAAQFYFRDMAVFKVMFTAIVTAMIGLFYFAWIGWVDLSLVYLTPTFLWADLVGGLILGIGFVVGGYCPGTSGVACVTGKVDGYIFILGLFFGIFAFGEAFPLIQGFFNAAPMGQITLSQFLDIPYGVLVFIVVLIALGGFMLAEKVEKYFARKDAEKAL